MGIKRGLKAKAMPRKIVDMSEDETALYDRQIRLWGIEAQKRLRDCRVLVIGLGGIGAEVAKNIVLAGVKSITLADNKKVSPSDHTSQFFLADAIEGTNRAAESSLKVHHLNPNVTVFSETGNIELKSECFFKNFGVICATDCSLQFLLKLDKICQDNKIHFFCGDTWGMHGYCFIDLGAHTYMIPAPKRNSSGEPVSSRYRKKLESIKYNYLEKILSLKHGKTGIGLHKKISKIFVLLHVLLTFRDTHKRNPEPAHREEDVESLKTMRKTVLTKLGFEDDKLPEEDLNDVFGELSPVCAVVAGVMSQEIIKSVCSDQPTLHNFFLFDGDTNVGIVESLG